jgi:hypothetical protein
MTGAENSPGLDSAVYLVLSRSKSIVSRMIHAMTRDEFTHAALALDAELMYMFSFGRRRENNPFSGCFKHERLDDEFYLRHRYLPGVIIKIPVTAEQYAGIAMDIFRFMLDGHKYSFDARGLVRAAVRLKRKKYEYKYFCSEFVYHILHKNRVCDLGKAGKTVSPQDLSGLDAGKIFRGNLLEYAPPNPGHNNSADVLPTVFLQHLEGREFTPHKPLNKTS